MTEHYNVIDQYKLLLALTLSESPLNLYSVFQVLDQAKGVLDPGAYQRLMQVARAFIRMEAMTP